MKLKLRQIGGAIFGCCVAAAAAYAATTTLTLGTNGSIGGVVVLEGATSGSVTVQPPAVAGTGTLFQLPGTDGSNGQFLKTDGSGVTSWATPAGSGTIASTTSALSGDGAGNAVAVTGTGSNCVHVDGTSAACAAGSGTVTNPSNLTTHAPVIGGTNGTTDVKTTAAMTNGQLLVGATGADAAPQTMSQDCTLGSTGVITCLKTNNVSFGTAATANTGTSGATIPLLNGTNTFSGTQTFGTVVGAINTQSGASYTLAATDCGKTILFTSASAITLTTLNSLPAGCNIAVEQGGAGQITVTDGSGATQHSAHSYTKTFAQYAIIGLFVDTNGGTSADFIITGDGA